MLVSFARELFFSVHSIPTKTIVTVITFFDPTCLC
jgi:hypothetical protein